MTCIIGLVKNNQVVLGADSAAVGGYSLELRGDTKVFRMINEDFIIGYTSSFRMGQLLRFYCKPREQKVGEDDYAYMCTGFIDAVRDCLKAGGYTKVKENTEEGGTFIIGYHRNIYIVYSDFQVGIPLAKFTACGCGADIALGAVAALYDNNNLTPLQIVDRALKIAESYSAGVRGPFNFVVGDSVADLSKEPKKPLPKDMIR